MKKTMLLAMAMLGGLLAAQPVHAQVLPCREFNTTVTIGGVRQPAWGTTCLQPDGTWQLVAPVQQQTMYDPAYLPDEQVYVVERPVIIRQYVQRPRPQAMWSVGYSSDSWHHRRYRHGWGSDVGVGFGHRW